MAHLTGSIGYPQRTTEAVPYSATVQSKIQLGTRARDMAGNEYVYVNFDAAKQKGEVVGYDMGTFLTADLTATSAGPIGVVVSYASASDLAGWLQIYGLCEQVLASSSLTSGGVEGAATTDGYSVVINATTGGVAIVRGMYITSAPCSSAITNSSECWTGTSQSSVVGITGAFLNYPFMDVSEITS